jgi:alkylhydroperoxidase family enzyme
MAAIWDYRSSPLFTAAERAAFDFAVAAASIPNAVDERVAANLRAHWDEGEIVEMLGVIALFGYLNRWNDSMATSLEEGADAIGTRQLAAHGWSRGKHL